MTTCGPRSPVWPAGAGSRTCPPIPRGLPLAAARNRAAAEATARGADHLVFLDVDCIPGSWTVATYTQALTDAGSTLAAPVVLGGDVAYLPPVPPGQRDRTAPADLARLAEVGQHRPDRVRLATGESRPEPDLTPRWSGSGRTCRPVRDPCGSGST